MRTLIDYLAAGGAKVDRLRRAVRRARPPKFMVGDTEWTGEESDRALVEATTQGRQRRFTSPKRRARSWSIRASGSRGPRASGAEPAVPVDACVERRPLVTPPFPALARAARAIGHTLLRLSTPTVRVRRTLAAASTVGEPERDPVTGAGGDDDGARG